MEFCSFRNSINSGSDKHPARTRCTTARATQIKHAAHLTHIPFDNQLLTPSMWHKLPHLAH